MKLKSIIALLLVCALTLALTACNQPYYPSFPKMPSDCSLEFWITENVRYVYFSKYTEIYGWMDAQEFLGKGYDLSNQNESSYRVHYAKNSGITVSFNEGSTREPTITIVFSINFA